MTTNNMDKMKVGAEELMTKVTDIFTKGKNKETVTVTNTDYSGFYRTKQNTYNDDKDKDKNYNNDNISTVDTYNQKHMEQEYVIGKTYDNVDLDKEYLEQRNKNIKEIQKELIDVSQMYKDVNDLIHNQSHFVDSIEDNIITTYENVDKAKIAVGKAEEDQKNNNNKLYFGVSVATLTTVLTTVLLIVLL